MAGNHGKNSYAPRVGSGLLIVTCALLQVLALLSDRGKGLFLWFEQPQEKSDGERSVSQALNTVSTTAKHLASDYKHILSSFVLEEHSREYRLIENNQTRLINYFTCSSTRKYATTSKYLTSGWAKDVYGAEMEGQKFVLKTPSLTGETVQLCRRRGHAAEDCQLEPKLRVLNEIRMLHMYAGKHVVKMRGYCIPHRFREVNSSIALIVEHGTPLNPISYYQLPWETRLELLVHAIGFLHDLESIQPVAVPDLKLDQFLIVDGTLKLTDADEFTPCDSKDTVCAASASKANRRKVYEIFGSTVAIDAPSSVMPGIRQLIRELNHPSASYELMFRLAEDVKRAFANSTEHGPCDVDKYFVQRSQTKTTGSEHPYAASCTGSFEDERCVLTASSLSDACGICLSLPFCCAFGWTGHRSWSGRWFIEIADRIPPASAHGNSTYYLKRSLVQ